MSFYNIAVNMILTLVISIITFAALILSIMFFPKLKISNSKFSTYWIVAIVGAILMIVTMRISPREVIDGLFNNDSSINPCKIIVLFFSMTFISIFLEEAGFFRYLANVAVRRAGNKQITLFIILYFLTSALTIVTSNDIVILTFTPFICYFCRNAKINPLPYLIAEFAAANTWSMMLIIGNPTNLYLGVSNGISFIEYFKIMVLPTIASGLVEFVVIFLLFRRQLSKQIDNVQCDEKLSSKLDTIIGLIHLMICIILMALSNLLKFEMWLISFFVALSLLLYFLISNGLKKNLNLNQLNLFKKLPWTLIPFVLSMFVIVLSIQNQGIAEKLAVLLGEKNTIWTYGITSYLFSNILNNIPMSILYSTLPSYTKLLCNNAVFASIVGSNIGAFLTPIGALAGIMFNSILKEHDVNISFKQFSFYGLVISVPTLIVTLIILQLII